MCVWGGGGGRLSEYAGWVANIVLKYSRRSHEIWACQNTSNNSETKCRRDVLHEGRKREGRGTILYSVPFAKHEGRHTHNQNDPHRCPQRTGRACLHASIVFARTCVLTNERAGINGRKKKSTIQSRELTATAIITSWIIYRCIDVITLTTANTIWHNHKVSPGCQR